MKWFKLLLVIFPLTWQVGLSQAPSVTITPSATYTITASVGIAGVTKTVSADVTIGVAASPQATLVLNGSSGTVGTPVSTFTTGGSGTGSALRRSAY